MNADNQKRILIVGGTAEPDLVGVMTDAGYSVETVATLDEASRKITSGIYSRVLADPVTFAALRESEEMYRNLVERSNDGVVVIQDTLVKLANPRFEEMSGYSASTLLNTRFTDYLTPEEVAVLLERYQRRMAGEYVPSIYETGMTRRGGRRVPLEISAALVTFHGRPADMIVVRDITERKQAEEYLQRYRLLSESAHDMVLFVGLDGRIIEANRAASDLHGYTREELLKMNIRELRPQGEGPGIRELLERARRESILFESMHLRKDGSTFPVEVSASGTLIENEPVLLIVLRDITERNRSQAVLDAERRRLRAVLDALPVAVVIADAAGGIVEANEQADIIWGGPIPRVGSIEQYDRFKGWWFDSGEPLAWEDWGMARAIDKGEVALGEMIVIERFDGKRGTILISSAPIRDARGQITGGVVAIEDVTELVELREALERSLEKTQRESNRASALESIAEAGLSTLTLPDLLDTLVKMIADALETDAACVFVLDEDTGEFEAHAAYNLPGLVGCRVRADEGLLGRVAKERRPVYVFDAEHDPMAFDSCEVRAAVKSMVGVPLIARGRVLGVVRVQTFESREFTEDDIHLLEAIADRVAMAVDNAKLYEALQRIREDLEETLQREQGFSLLLQRALLPARPVLNEQYNIAVRYVAAFASREIGGDFYDIFLSGNDDWAGVLIGDVAGKGLEAASLAAATRSTIHAFVHQAPSASEALASANSVLCSQRPSTESFVTVCLVTIDLASGAMRVSNAGHPPAVILRADGHVEFVSRGGLPLAVLDDQTYEESSDRLDPGDKLLMYTDGIIEARTDSELFGLDGIERCLAGHQSWSVDDVADGLIAAATEWAEGKLRDDTAIVVIERNKPNGKSKDGMPNTVSAE